MEESRVYEDGRETCRRRIRRAVKEQRSFRLMHSPGNFERWRLGSLNE